MSWVDEAVPVAAKAVCLWHEPEGALPGEDFPCEACVSMAGMMVQGLVTAGLAPVEEEQRLFHLSECVNGDPRGLICDRELQTRFFTEWKAVRR